MTEQQALTSQEQLAQKITNALFEAKLITDSNRDKLPQQITLGLLDANDWSLLVDMLTGQDANKHGNNQVKDDDRPN